MLLVVAGLAAVALAAAFAFYFVRKRKPATTERAPAPRPDAREAALKAPEKPARQEHRKPPRVLLQPPRFRHGLERHSFTSMLHS